jgi:hypothetical protein
MYNGQWFWPVYPATVVNEPMKEAKGMESEIKNE